MLDYTSINSIIKLGGIDMKDPIQDIFNQKNNALANELILLGNTIKNAIINGDELNYEAIDNLLESLKGFNQADKLLYLHDDNHPFNITKQKNL